MFYSLGVLNQKLVECLRMSERSFQKTCQDLLDTTNLTLQSTSSSASLHQSVSSAAFLTSSQQSSGGGGAQFPGRSTMPNVGSMSQFRAQLWTNIEKLMDTMYDACAQVIQLQLILEKKKDLVSNLLYVDELDLAAIFTQKMFLANPTAATATTTSGPVSPIPNGAESFTDASLPPLLPSVSVYESICAVLLS